mmetsp:Transcript_80621/g.233797  ORF Transcript_80621/g.233797 Transcript_80621/m.233797 type:complete len:367 (-) Transcript_80621:300-1400(-)
MRLLCGCEHPADLRVQRVRDLQGAVDCDANPREPVHPRWQPPDVEALDEVVCEVAAVAAQEVVGRTWILLDHLLDERLHLAQCQPRPLQRDALPVVMVGMPARLVVADAGRLVVERTTERPLHAPDLDAGMEDAAELDGREAVGEELVQLLNALLERDIVDVHENGQPTLAALAAIGLLPGRRQLSEGHAEAASRRRQALARTPGRQPWRDRWGRHGAEQVFLMLPAGQHRHRSLGPEPRARRIAARAGVKSRAPPLVRVPVPCGQEHGELLHPQAVAEVAGRHVNEHMFPEGRRGRAPLCGDDGLGDLPHGGAELEGRLLEGVLGDATQNVVPHSVKLADEAIAPNAAGPASDESRCPAVRSPEV